MTITSLTIKEYFKSKGDTTTNSINLSMPYSLRQPPESCEDVDFRNDFAALMVKLDLIDDFESGLKVIKCKMDALKKSLEPFGMYYFI